VKGGIEAVGSRTAGRVAGLVLAAGAARRFGSPKQLALLGGRPLLEHALATITAAGLDRVVVVLGSHADQVLAGVDLQGAEAVRSERWSEGQAASLACGLDYLTDGRTDAVVVALGDQPGLSPAAIARVLAARGQAPAVRATYAGAPGHPVVIEAALFPALRAATGETGAREVLGAAGVCTVACDDLGGGADVDTPAQLTALRCSSPAGTAE
jgi:nicotine blue oxidoreductase